MNKQYIEMIASNIQAEQYYEGKKVIPDWAAYLFAIASTAWQSFASHIICGIFGHKIVEDDSYCAKGSGRVTISCTRCGYSHTGYW